ncbi:MAG: hypothetical protein JSU86_05000, partial [Phycisphaerales bacterium]
MSGAVSTLRSAVSSCAAWAVLLGAAGVPVTYASDEEATTPEGPKYLSLDHLDAYLELEGEYSYTRVETSRRVGYGRNIRQRNRDWRLEERIGLELGGWVWDPGLISFGGDFSVALTQSRFKEEADSFDRTDDDNGYLLEFDLRANFFQGQELSGSVYGLRLEDRINRRFQPTLNQRRTGFGTSWV